MRHLVVYQAVARRDPGVESRLPRPEIRFSMRKRVVLVARETNWSLRKLGKCLLNAGGDCESRNL